MADIVSIKLNQPAIFGDLNTLEGKPTDHQRDNLEMRFPQFRDLPRLKELDYNGKVVYCATEMARLSEDDLDELSVSDARQMLQAALDIIIRFNEACDEYWAEEIKEARK